MRRARRKFAEVAWRPLLALWAIVSMVALLPIMGGFLHNRHEAALQDLIIPVLLALVVSALVVALSWRRYSRERLAGLLMALLATIILTSGFDSRLEEVYALFSALMPFSGLGAFEGPLFSIILIAIVFVICGYMGRALARLANKIHWKHSDLLRAIGIAIGVIFLSQFIPTAKTLVVAWPQYFYKPPALNGVAKAGSDKPDIYYIVLDRYANADVLKQQLGYDNEEFLRFLDDYGYYVNSNSHANYPYTTMSIASTLNMDYHRDLVKHFGDSSSQSIVPYHRSVQYAAVTQQIKSAGYEFDQIGTWYEATNRAPLADEMYLQDSRLTLFGHTSYINNFTKNWLQQSPFWRIIKAGPHLGSFKLADYEGQNQVALTTYQLSTLNKLADSKPGGRFIFAHMLIPHDPYYFNADGSLSSAPNSNNEGKPIQQKYLGQVKYINDQMKILLDKIERQSDGKAVVVLQADEGPYPMQLNDEIFNSDTVSSEINDSDMRKWSDKNLDMKYGNLAAYRIPLATAEDMAAGANNVNVFRVILNRYFGYDLNYLAPCYYAFPSGRKQPMLYEDITRRLDDSTMIECAKNGTGPK